MENLILYVLKVYEAELPRAKVLAELLRDICPDDYYLIADALLVYRRDCPRSESLEKVLGETFRDVSLHRSNRREVGHPAGANGMWCSAMDAIGQGCKTGQYKYECVLTTEVDACPLCAQWPERLLAAWRRECDRKPISVAGHFHSGIEDHSGVGHINGNALFAPDLALKTSKIKGCRADRSWDTWFAPDFRQLGWADIPEIRNQYRQDTITPAELHALVDKGCVWLHGVRDFSAMDWARKTLRKKFSDC